MIFSAFIGQSLRRKQEQEKQQRDKEQYRQKQKDQDLNDRAKQIQKTQMLQKQVQVDVRVVEYIPYIEIVEIPMQMVIRRQRVEADNDDESTTGSEMREDDLIEEIRDVIVQKKVKKYKEVRRTIKQFETVEEERPFHECVSQAKRELGYYR